MIKFLKILKTIILELVIKKKEFKKINIGLLSQYKFILKEKMKLKVNLIITQKWYKIVKKVKVK